MMTVYFILRILIVKGGDPKKKNKPNQTKLHVCHLLAVHTYLMCQTGQAGRIHRNG